MSNPASDYDNPIKPTQDAICARIGINDNRIRRGIAEVIDCKKRRGAGLFRDQGI